MALFSDVLLPATPDNMEDATLEQKMASSRQRDLAHTVRVRLCCAEQNGVLHTLRIVATASVDCMTLRGVMTHRMRTPEIFLSLLYSGIE